MDIFIEKHLQFYVGLNVKIFFLKKENEGHLLMPLVFYTACPLMNGVISSTSTPFSLEAAKTDGLTDTFSVGGMSSLTGSSIPPIPISFPNLVLGRIPISACVRATPAILPIWLTLLSCYSVRT